MYYRDRSSLSRILLSPSPNSPRAIVIRGKSFVMYGIYSGETRGTIEVLQPPVNGVHTVVVKYGDGAASTMTVNVATGAARLAVISDANVFEGSCN